MKFSPTTTAAPVEAAAALGTLADSPVPEETGGSWLTVDEASRRWRVCPSTVRRWVRAGRVQWVQPGGVRGKILISPTVGLKGGAVASQGREEGFACEEACETSSGSASENAGTEGTGLSSFDPMAEEVATDLLRRWEASQRRKPSRKR